ncbi:FecR domain-containing protein [Spirosoma soli]|uniref:FecR domain-containing protein n=1 Tax=Spirosoma soli TaxID=1770529 RepID=A0ABW5M804_9BACT
MEYREFSAIDLATDPAFIDWVQRPDSTNLAFWETFLAQNPDRAEVVAAARQLVTGWQINTPTASADDMDSVWHKIQAATTDHTVSSQSRFVINRSSYWRWATAASVVLVLLTGGLWFFNKSHTVRYVTQRGETKTVQLPDKSTVVLNTSSSLEFSGDWKANQPREVTLTGEAFFSVTHQQNQQSFTVRTPENLRVEVLGTTFTVSEQATKTRVVLNSGKVRLYVSSGAQPLLMKPGELVEVSKNRQEVVRRKVVPDVYSTWKDNQFVFDDTSLGEVAEMIGRQFGDTVEFADDSLRNRRITLRLPTRDLDLLLVSVAEMHDLKIERQANHIRIAATPAAK